MIVVSRCQSKPNEIVVEKVVERKVEVPSSLLTCSAEAVAGSTWMSQRDVAYQRVKISAADEDRHTNLKAVAKFIHLG